MEKTELLELFKGTYNRIFEKPEHTKHKYYQSYYQNKYENQLRISSSKPYVDEFYRYVEEEFVYIINSIYNTGILEIPEYMDYYSLDKVRRCLGILPNIYGEKEISKTVLHRLVVEAIIKSQSKYHNEKRSLEGPISLDTPINQFFITARAYNLITGETDLVFRTKKLTLKHLVWYTGHAHRRLGAGVKFEDEIHRIVRSTGHDSREELTGKNFDYDICSFGYAKKINS